MWPEEKCDNAQFEAAEFLCESGESSNCDLTELVYKLNWTLRDAIILNLNCYTKQLFGKRLGTAAEERLLQSNADLYQRLISLPLKSDEEADDRPNEIVLELAFGVRGEILHTLITNQSLSKSSVIASKEIRMKMIQKNNSLVSTLMKLSVNVSDGVSQGTANGRISNGKLLLKKKILLNL